ncbi:Cyclin D-interacting protein GCIP [Ceraceosorus bombacis]|uniref:Pre-mRNA-splicing factor SYF2 n=1 Tax=Ceraceosorus bombacis TaxID=401625 RepID=A0A0P1BAK9_9BASI|nr:Cyclin D-interacting protein GCIP [Ceraceosorus bombacis]
MSMAERMSKMKELRKKMNDSSQANRRAVAQEASRNKSSRSATSSSRKFLKAERILDERDQLSRGEDPSRARNWAYSIEDAERWNEKLQSKEVRRDKGDEDAQSTAERGYNRKIKDMKPDLNGYRKAKEADLGVGSASSSSSGALIRTASGSSQMARRGDVQIPTSQSLSYGTHKPNEEALDKVISHMNVESTFKANRSRKRAEDPDAEVNYINNENKHFNNKIRRFYDESTRTIRENLERGTAL